MKKGIYTIITTFFFIIMVLVVALGIVFFGGTMTAVNSKVDQNLNKFVIARNARDSIYYCYGKVLDEKNLDSGLCKLSNKTFQITDGLIMGYRVQKLAVNNCSPKNWSSVNITQIDGKYKDMFVYTVPVLENKTYVCLGQMEVYI